MRYLVVGMGKSGFAVANRLNREGCAFDTFDDRLSESKCRETLGEIQFNHFNKPEMVPASSYSEAIISPGISIRHPLLNALRSAGTALVGEIEFAFRRCQGNLVAVTGSNGKSTTATLIHHILSGCGLSSRLCGNIGLPFTDCVDAAPDVVYVAEISSFQMEHVQTFAPDVGILLNIAPDHIDRHGSFEAYRDAKLQMFAFQKAHQWAVLPADFPVAHPGAGITMTVPSHSARWDGECLKIGESFTLNAAQIPLLGDHNRQNALFSCLAATYFGLSSDQVAQAIATFQGLPHRLERLGEWEGRIWINDSKATNVHATQAAVTAMEQPYVLILGGCDKGERFDSLNLETRPPKAIVAYGETGPAICQDLAAFKPVYIADFEAACRQAHQLASSGDAVLLAPACASFDQFTSYTHRGDSFRNLFHQLGGAGCRV